MDEQMRKYRQHLVLAEQKAQEDFDKTVFALSGGALGVSFTFVTDIVGSDAILEPGLMVSAWISWGMSLLSVLSSYYFSHLALRKAIKQVDMGRIISEHPGGFFDKATAVLNAVGALLFVLGLAHIIRFINMNLGV